MTDLLPCPFCGGEARYITRSGMTGRATKHVWREATVQCKKGSCGVSTKVCKGIKAKEKAALIWNARNAQIEHKGTVE